MPISIVKNAFVDPTTAAIGVSQMFAETAGSSNPAYLVLTVLDRNEYTAGASGTTGYLMGNGHTLNLSSLGGDGRGAGIVFTYQSSTGRYFSTTYGYLDQLVYYSSGSANDVTNLSLFGTNSLSTATSYANNAYNMMQADPSGYIGSATVVTHPGAAVTVPSQATPDSIAAIADGFIGQAWNMDGCWVLASTIAAEAGASLPVQSTEIGLPGQSNGEWIVAFNGPAGQSGNWQSLVKEGEVVVIGTPGGGGHITTCVSGSGASAMLVDNATFEGSNGQIQNAANDGSASDIIIAAPHLASQEWSGVQASSVVIYELDTPIVTDAVISESLGFHASAALASWFTAVDPANKVITEWQVYDTAGVDSFGFNGTSYSDHSAASALTAASLSQVTLLTGATAATDTLEVRAFNGTYWGDWTALNVAVAGAIAAPPVLSAQTPNQTWNEAAAISLIMPGNTFTDPQGQTLVYTAAQSNGQALPTWLTFNAATKTFSGTAPNSVQTLTIKVTATDTSGLSASESFTASVQAPPPPPLPLPAITVSNPTPNQTWIDGTSGLLVLPSNTFTDNLGLKMTFVAYEVSGPNDASWLHFDPSAGKLYGNVPASATGTIGLEIVATDARNVVAKDLFTLTFAAGSSHITAGISGSTQAITPVTPIEMVLVHS